MFIDLHNGLPCLDIGMEFRAIWHGALVVWVLRGCHVYPNTGVKWLNHVADEPFLIPIHDIDFKVSTDLE